MCIRDRRQAREDLDRRHAVEEHAARDDLVQDEAEAPHVGRCLLYTSDAADERSSVDLGGRRIIKKKTKAEPDDCGVHS
mgnify:CR=1 FL=1